VIAAGTIVALGCGVAAAQEVRTVHAPMTFDAEAGPLRTSACLQVTERVYPATAWWESPAVNASGPDRAFKSVIAAMKQKDRAALLKLTDPTQARETARFDQQANAFFRQFEVIQLLAVPRAYELDGLVVFFGQFRSATQTVFVPLVFAHAGDDSFVFLPSRSKQMTLSLVEDWFAPSGKGTDTPSYCTEAEIKRATHRVALGASTWRPSALLLTGAPFDAPGGQSPVSASAAQVKSTIDQMKAALRGTDVNEFYKYLTPEGADRLRKWFEAAQQTDRDQYKSAFVDQQPFFVFDESPLIVVYIKTRTSGIQVLYFTKTTDNRLLWTNSSNITVSDQVFKQGPLFAASASPQPFSTVVIK